MGNLILKLRISFQQWWHPPQMHDSYHIAKMVVKTGSLNRKISSMPLCRTLRENIERSQG